MRKLIVPFLASGTIALAASAVAQDNSIPPPPEPDRDVSDTFVETWGNIQAKKKKAFEVRGKGQQLNGLRSQVRNTIRKTSKASFKITRASEIPELQIEEITQLLGMLGYEPSDLAKDKNFAQNVVDAAYNIKFGSPNFADISTLSPVIVVAQFSGYASDTDTTDGFNATANFAVSSVVKGTISAGSQISVRQSRPDNSEKPETSDSQSALTDNNGTFLLFLSEEAYRQRVSLKGKKPKKGKEVVYSEVFTPYIVQNGSLHRTAYWQPELSVSTNSLVK